MYKVFIWPVVSTTNRPKCLSSGVGVGVAEGAEVEALAEEELWEQGGGGRVKSSASLCSVWSASL